jgi:hypothetical protein
MVYVLDSTNLNEIANRLYSSKDWLYSPDGQQLYFATGFLQKTKVKVLSMIASLLKCKYDLYFCAYKQQAFLHLFPEEMRPLIQELSKVEIAARQVWFSMYKRDRDDLYNDMCKDQRLIRMASEINKQALKEKYRDELVSKEEFLRYKYAVFRG